MRQGLPAGISTTLGFSAGALTNVFTQGWSWPVGVGLGVLVVGWVTWEIRQGAVEHASARSALDAAGPAQSGQNVSAIPRHLPATVRHFAGREAELSALDRELEQARTRTDGMVICAVVGTAGVGKTTLVVRWAHRVSDEFPDGQLYVNLRGFDPARSAVTPAEAVRGFLDAFQVPPQQLPVGVEAQAALYRSIVATKRVLVLLDNARDAEQVRPLIPGSPGSLVLVTSRHALTSLVTLDGARPLRLDLMSRHDARQLMEHRLGSERVAAEPDAVEEITTRCARLPLAMALVTAHAAARPNFKLGTLAEELREADRRLDMFSGDDALSDMRAVLSWSYRALAQDAARIFRLFGLHPEPDVSVAAAATLAALPVTQIRPRLAELTGSHLITEHLPDRYSCHDLLRAYAMEQLDSSDTDDERRAATGRLLDYYVHTACAASRLIEPHGNTVALSPPQPGATPEVPVSYDDALGWFTTERRALIAMVERAATVGFDMQACRLARALDGAICLSGRWDDLAVVGRIVVAAAQRISDTHALAEAYHMVGHASFRLGRDDEAAASFRQALALFQRVEDRPGQAETSMFLARLRARQGRDVEALDHARQAVLLYRSVSDSSGQARALNAAGWYHAVLGDQQQALGSYQEALTRFVDLGDRRGQAVTWHNLGDAEHHLGHHDRAVVCYRRAIKLCHDLGDRDGEGVVLVQLGDAYTAAGDVKAARDTWQQALTILDVTHRFDADQVRTKLAALDTYP